MAPAAVCLPTKRCKLVGTDRWRCPKRCTAEALQLDHNLFSRVSNGRQMNLQYSLCGAVTLLLCLFCETSPLCKIFQYSTITILIYLFLQLYFSILNLYFAAKLVQRMGVKGFLPYSVGYLQKLKLKRYDSY